MATKVIFVTSTGAVTVPSDFGTLVSVEVIGAGAGGKPAPSGTGGEGGGGGAYSKSTAVTGITANGTIYVSTGAGGSSGTAGGDTWVNASSNAAPTLTTQGALAKGGAIGSSGTGGLGGAAASGVGTTKFSGGNGGNSVSGAFGGGGGAAGPSGAGANGGAGNSTNGGGGGGGGSNGGSAGAVGSNTGGDGGNGVGGTGGGLKGNNTNGTAGTAGTGAGGGGALGSTFVGGNGATGSIYTQTSNSATAGPGGGGGGTWYFGTTGGAGGLYGGGGGGAVTGGAGAGGLIVFTYNTVEAGTLNTSGPISLGGTTAGQSIQLAIGGTGTSLISLNDSTVRTLAGIASGSIVMPTNFYGKSYSYSYLLQRSLRFRSSASAYLSRTPATATNRTTWTWSAWVKLGYLNTGAYCLFSAYLDDNNRTTLYYQSNQLIGQNILSGSADSNIQTSAVYRDSSAWYHVMWVYDSTNATAANRSRFYINGALATTTTSYPSASATSLVNYTCPQNICRLNYSTPQAFFDGYLAEVNFIDGQALTPSSFGSTNALTGVWQPAAYTGTYGTNGFYLPFTDNSALTTSSNVGLGKDFSGNGNYWTTNNISITAGVTYDSMTDVPTLTSATASNFAVMNPVNTTTQLTFSNANLATTYASGTWNLSRATIGVSSGSWYWEVTAGGANNNFIGIANSAAGVYDALGANANSAGWNFGGAFFYNGTSVGFGVSWTTGDVIGVAFNATTNVITFYKNNVVVNSGGTATAVTGGLYFPANSQSAGTFNVNFGQQPFTYTPPTGFLALNTYNLPVSAILKGNQYMDATLWSGTGTNQSIVNAGGFLVDFLWGKIVNAADQNFQLDSVRGVVPFLNSNSTGIEVTDQPTTLISYNSNGFTVGSSTNLNRSGGYNFVGWQWKAGGGSNVTNTTGSITSTVSTSTTAGFSILTYTGTGVNATVGHGLPAAPQVVITKSRNDGTYGWTTYHVSVGAGACLFLNTAGASNAGLNIWNNTAPTSSVFSLGSDQYANFGGKTYVAYCWTPIAGFSQFGSYAGNGSTAGPFVYTGFLPRWVMIKRTDTTGDWYILDTARGTYNSLQNYLLADSSNAEANIGAPGIDILSNGFKLVTTAVNFNGSGGTFVYMAFASNPFRNSLAF